MSVLPGTHFHLSQVKHDISLKILHQAEFEIGRQATTAKRQALTTVPYLSRYYKNMCIVNIKITQVCKTYMPNYSDGIARF